MKRSNAVLLLLLSLLVSSHAFAQQHDSSPGFPQGAGDDEVRVSVPDVAVRARGGYIYGTGATER